MLNYTRYPFHKKIARELIEYLKDVWDRDFAGAEYALDFLLEFEEQLIILDGFVEFMSTKIGSIIQNYVEDYVFDLELWVEDELTKLWVVS